MLPIFRGLGVPIGHLIINIKNNNFGDKVFLRDKGLVINLKKYKWSYTMNKMSDRLIIYLTGSVIDNNYDKYQQADIHILDNITNDLFLKISKANIGECEKVIKREDKKNNHLIYTTVCSYGKSGIVYWHIPSKRIIISYYPYIDNVVNQEKIKNFIEGIEIIDM